MILLERTHKDSHGNHYGRFQCPECGAVVVKRVGRGCASKLCRSCNNKKIGDLKNKLFHNGTSLKSEDSPEQFHFDFAMVLCEYVAHSTRAVSYGDWAICAAFTLDWIANAANQNERRV